MYRVGETLLAMRLFPRNVAIGRQRLTFASSKTESLMFLGADRTAILLGRLAQQVERPRISIFRFSTIPGTLISGWTGKYRRQNFGCPAVSVPLPPLERRKTGSLTIISLGVPGWNWHRF